jgi:hypothetical protein
VTWFALSPPATTTVPFSARATTRDNAIGSPTEIVVAVTTGRAATPGAGSLEAGAGLPDPPVGGRDDAGVSGDGGTGRSALGEGGNDVAPDFGEGPACGVVQPASTSVRLAIVSATLLVIHQGVFAAAADITNPLWPRHMTNP